MAHHHHIILQLLGLFALFVLSTVESSITSFTSIDAGEGTKWAVLVAGSTGYENYRHQSSVCHAYQILKKGGLKDENIIVFMYDDIAYNKDNPIPGVIVNHPDGPNVYAGVPKDYTGSNLTVHNLLAVIRGDKNAVKGGSGKVLKSGPNDHVFLFFSSHGGWGTFEMTQEEDLLAYQLNETLTKKHDSKTYKQMVIYFNSCYSGAMFDFLFLPKDMYVATSAAPRQPSYAAYNDNKHNAWLGTQFGVSWMEDSEQNDRKTRTLAQQYEAVKKGVKDSTVMQYGDISISKETLSSYMGAASPTASTISSKTKFSIGVSDFDVEIYDLMQKAIRALTSRSEKKKEAAERELYEALKQRAHVDDTFKAMVVYLFGKNKGPKLLNQVPKLGQSVVNDWDCFEKSLKTYKKYCGPLSIYAHKYTGAFANMCKAGVHIGQLAQAAAKACG
ncbi:hypothetical protein Ancab_022997 [Ancistrocladus abbreviatus]